MNAVSPAVTVTAVVPGIRFATRSVVPVPLPLGLSPQPPRTSARRPATAAIAGRRRMRFSGRSAVLGQYALQRRARAEEIERVAVRARERDAGDARQRRGRAGGIDVEAVRRAGADGVDERVGGGGVR